MTVNVTRTLAHKCKLAALGTPTTITYHCADTPEGRDDKAEKIVGMDMVKFHQPSYHIIVELDGTSVQCLKFTELGAHVGLHNHHNIGVCYVGGRGLDGKVKDTRTPAQKLTLRRLDNELRATFKTITVSKGHRDWSPDLDHDGKVKPHEWMKMCPCFDVATQL